MPTKIIVRIGVTATQGISGRTKIAASIWEAKFLKQMLQKQWWDFCIGASEAFLLWREQRSHDWRWQSDRSDEPLTPVNSSGPLLIFTTSTQTVCFLLGGLHRLVYFIEIRKNWGGFQLTQPVFLAWPFLLAVNGHSSNVRGGGGCCWRRGKTVGRRGGWVEWGLMVGNHSGENGSCGERRAWLHWDSALEGAACSAQSELHKKEKKCSYQPVMTHLTITQARNGSI